MASLYSGCNNLSPDFFPELLLLSISDSNDRSSEYKKSPNSWLENMIFLRKTAIEAGVFGIFVIYLSIYLSIPKPYLSLQFATTSMRSATLAAQLDSEIEKDKEGFRLEDIRQESTKSTIGTTLETEASGSGVSGSDVDKVRRTTSSATSIEPRDSGLPFFKSGSSEMDSSLLEEPLPLLTMQRSQQLPQLEKIEEQEIVTHAPEIQEMATGAAGRSPVNAARFARRTETAPHRRSVRQPLVENRPLDRSSQVQALQSSLSGPESFNQSVLQTQKRRCSPCSESIIRCCQTSFKPLTDRFRDHARTLSQSGPSSLVPAQRLVSLRNAPSNELSTEISTNELSTEISTNELSTEISTNELSTEISTNELSTEISTNELSTEISTNELSTEISRFEWDDRLTDELAQEYFSQPTEEDKEEFFDTCVSNVSESKANRFLRSIESKEKSITDQQRDKAIVRVSEISPHLHYSRLFDDTAPEGGFSEGSSRQFREGNYEENVLWQLRLVPNNAAQIKPTDIDSYSTMQSYSGDITEKQVASLRRQLERCSEKVRKAQERGRKRLLEVAIENGHIRTLPVIFDGHYDEQNVNNIAVILKHEPHCKFSADKKVAVLVEQASRASI